MFFQIPSEPLFETELLGLAQNGAEFEETNLRRPLTTLWQVGKVEVYVLRNDLHVVSRVSSGAIQQPTQCCGSLTSIGTILTTLPPRISENNTRIISILNHVI